MPRALPVLRGRRAAVVPDVPAQRRRVSRRAVQHRLVRAADDDGGAGLRSRSRAISSTRSATRTSTSNHLDQAREQLTREPRPLPSMRLNPAVTSIFDFKLQRLHARELRPASVDQGADRGVMRVSSLEVETLVDLRPRRPRLPHIIPPCASPSSPPSPRTASSAATTSCRGTCRPI